MKVILADAAYDDLLRIGRTIKKDNPTRAETFVADYMTAASVSEPCRAHFRSYPIGKRVACVGEHMATI